jgi:hypothetical protein
MATGTLPSHGESSGVIFKAILDESKEQSMDVAKRMEGNHKRIAEVTGTSRCSPRRSGPDHLQRVSNGGRRVAGHGPWRPVSGNVRREGDLGRNLAIERFAASSVFSGRSARDFAVGVGGQQSFRHLALGGWGKGRERSSLSTLAEPKLSQGFAKRARVRRWFAWGGSSAWTRVV